VFFYIARNTMKDQDPTFFDFFDFFLISDGRYPEINWHALYQPQAS